MSTQEQISISADTNAYINMMEEIKYRVNVIAGLINGKINMMYNITQAESTALQIRMIIESIALASLSANKSLFEQEGDKFKEYWKADRIFEDIEKQNPDFYPKPIKELPSNIPGIKTESIDIEDGFMTRNEIIQVHQHCCDFLHAKNPYAQERDYEGFMSQIPNWLDRIMRLLNNHQIKLLNDEGHYVVHMREAEREDRVAMYYFAPVTPEHPKIHPKIGIFQVFFDLSNPYESAHPQLLPSQQLSECACRVGIGFCGAASVVLAVFRPINTPRNSRPTHAFLYHF